MKGKEENPGGFDKNGDAFRWASIPLNGFDGDAKKTSRSEDEKYADEKPKAEDEKADGDTDEDDEDERPLDALFAEDEDEAKEYDVTDLIFPEDDEDEKEQPFDDEEFIGIFEDEDEDEDGDPLCEDGKKMRDSDSNTRGRIARFKKDALAGSADAAFVLGVYTLCGFGLKKSGPHGIALIGLAASMGCEESMRVLSEMNEEDRVTCGVDGDGNVVYVKPSDKDEKIAGETEDALGWANFKVALAYLEGETIFKSTGEAEKWEDRANERGCCLLRIFEDLEHKYGNDAMAVAASLERAARDARSAGLKKRFADARDGLLDALDAARLAAYDRFDTPDFMDEHEEIESRFDDACLILCERIDEAKNILREIGGDGE